MEGSPKRRLSEDGGQVATATYLNAGIRTLPVIYEIAHDQNSRAYGRHQDEEKPGSSGARRQVTKTGWSRRILRSALDMMRRNNESGYGDPEQEKTKARTEKKCDGRFKWAFFGQSARRKTKNKHE
ncbi:MAG: hypothetical protein Q9216_006877 [Gyalolechia sp. 2 TL-2023]